MADDERTPMPVGTSPVEPAPAADDATGPRDEGIYCPNCDYNLTGLEGALCPECGSTFDREQLRAAVAVGLVPLMPWEHRQPGGGDVLRAFWQTVSISCGQPKRFAAAFSVRPPVSKSLSFYAACLAAHAAAMATLTVPILIEHYLENAQRSSPRSIGDDLAALAGIGIVPFLTVSVAKFLLEQCLAVMMPQADLRRRVGP